MSKQNSADGRRERGLGTAAQEARDLLAESDAFEADMASSGIARRNDKRTLPVKGA